MDAVLSHYSKYCRSGNFRVFRFSRICELISMIDSVHNNNFREILTFAKLSSLRNLRKLKPPNITRPTVFIYTCSLFYLSLRVGIFPIDQQIFHNIDKILQSMLSSHPSTHRYLLKSWSLQHVTLHSQS